MDSSLVNPQRRAVRRAVRTRCHAISSRGSRLLGELALDVSPRGMLVACDGPAALGESVYIGFVLPGPKPVWLDAEAEISRVVHGLRAADPGYCVGLRFTYFERAARAEVLTRLAGLPPPVPRRPLTAARQRWPRPTGAGGFEAAASVLLRPVLLVSGGRGGVPGVPAGVFSA